MQAFAFFASVCKVIARGDATPQSDINLRIGRGSMRGLQGSGFLADIADDLGLEVDAATTESLSEEFPVDEENPLLNGRFEASAHTLNGTNRDSLRPRDTFPLPHSSPHGGKARNRLLVRHPEVSSIAQRIFGGSARIIEIYRVA